ncbi:hypothetical protein PC119_g27155 [Phytophthora cactorum]|nr:hypothetical protein PC119_g27155 [Phytophthora cactorum]
MAPGVVKDAKDERTDERMNGRTGDDCSGLCTAGVCIGERAGTGARGVEVRVAKRASAYGPDLGIGAALV